MKRRMRTENVWFEEGLSLDGGNITQYCDDVIESGNLIDKEKLLLKTIEIPFQWIEEELWRLQPFTNFFLIVLIVRSFLTRTPSCGNSLSPGILQSPRSMKYVWHFICTVQ